MISSRTLKVFLVGLALSMKTMSVNSSIIARPPTSVRGRFLEEDGAGETEDAPAPETNEPSPEEETNSVDGPSSADSGNSATRSAGIAPRARECTTRKLFPNSRFAHNKQMYLTR